MNAPGRSLTRKVFAFAWSAILIGLITLLMLEVVLRVIGFSRTILYEPDSLIGWSGRPGAEGIYRDEGRAEIGMSSAGVRDRERTVAKPRDVWRVAVLGDSFTEALQVAEDKRFTSVMEGLLTECDAGKGRRVEVLNFGVSGFGTAQEYLLLKDRVLSYAPDVIVLAFLPGNDITDNVRALDQSLASRPYVTLNGSGQLAWDRSFEDSPSFRIKSSAIFRAVLLASDFSRVIQGAFFVHDKWRMKRTAEAGKKTSKQIEQGLSDGQYAPPRTLEWQQAWKITEKLIEKMNSLTTHSGARFLLVTLSSGIQVQPDAKRSAEAAARLGVADLFYADDRLQAFAVQKKIEVVSLARPLAEYARRENVFLHGFPETTLGSGHWNEKGHQAAGELIARYLCRRPASGKAPDPAPS